MIHIVLRRSVVAIALVCAACLLAVAIGQAQIPKTVSYQGILTDAGGAVVPDGNYSLAFKLYAVASSGSALWSETQSVSTTKGIFSVVLGASTPIDLAFDKQYWLGITVGAGSEMSPRVAITSGAYSFRSVRADTASWLNADFGVGGSMACGTPLGNGPGWIMKAPNGERRDIFAGNGGTVVDYKLFVNKDGNVGVGTSSWPGGKLGVNGDIFVSGNLTKSYSVGTRNNATPLAFGTIKADGTISTATPNVTCSWNAGNSWYEITIADVNYFWTDYVTVVTPMGGTGTFLVPVTQSVSGNVVVQIFNLSGTRVQGYFSFMTYKP
jgi:hypothetical protein